MVLGAINTALWPRASALTSRKKTTEMLKKTFRLSAILAFCVSIYALSAPKLTPYIFGIDYADGVLLGQILCLRYCLAILICPIGVIGYSMGLVRTYWLVNLIQMIVVVCINIILLPRIGVMGAVIALIANETVGFVIFGTIISRKILSWRSY
jgi:O-antigen/teichoic acid export membrane protein